MVKFAERELTPNAAAPATAALPHSRTVSGSGSPVTPMRLFIRGSANSTQPAMRTTP
jgi:hypothetical protein